MKRQTDRSPEQEREMIAFRREAQERMNNRPTFDLCLGMYWPTGFEAERIH